METFDTGSKNPQREKGNESQGISKQNRTETETETDNKITSIAFDNSLTTKKIS